MAFNLRRFTLSWFLGITLIWWQVANAVSPTIIKSPLDERQYLTTTLENGLKVVVVSDKEAHQASAALVVRAGSFEDPPAFKGLAHFLEHTLFLGTKKFPVPDQFQNFVQEHGGARNATTTGEYTHYYFHIQPDFLSPALEQFADFFISPLFNKNLIERELNAVEAEFQLHWNNDGSRVWEVMKETSNPNHPFAQFAVGNLATLAHDKEKLYANLLEFYKQHYAASKMTLALVGPQSTAQLLEWATQYFSNISDHSTPIVKRPPVFTAAELGLDIFMKSQGEHRDLKLTFPIANEHNLHQEKAGQIIAILLGYEGRGGLSLALRKRGWITSLSSNYENFTCDQDALSLHFSLTPEGLQHIDEITYYTFAYVDLINKRGVAKQWLKELEIINQASFLYTEKGDSLALADTLAHDLQLIPADKLLTHHYFLPQNGMSTKELKGILAKLTPANLRRYIVSSQESTEQQSQWYKAQYRSAKFNPQQLAQFTRKRFYPELNLPKKNQFLAEDFTQRETLGASNLPKRLALPGLVLWHHHDSQFKRPKADIMVNFISPFTINTPENNLYGAIFTQVVADVLREELYPAAVAGASIRLYEHSRGITLVLSGYTDKQDKVFAKILKHLHHYKVDNHAFLMIKDRLVRDLINYHQATLFEKAHTELNVLLQTPAWHPDDLLKVANNLTPEKFNTFLHSFWQSSSLEMLVHGNYNVAQALTLAKQLLSEFPKSAANNLGTLPKIVKLPAGSKQFKTIVPSDKNHVAVAYLQNPQQDFATRAKTLLLGHYCEVPFYQSLRVNKQLGYALGASAYSMQRVNGLLFWVQSSATSSDKLFNSIQSFLIEANLGIKKLSGAEFNALQQALLHELNMPPKTLLEQSLRWWGTIERGEYEFDYREKLIRAITETKLGDLVTFSEKMLIQTQSLGQLWVLSPTNNQLKLGKEISSLANFQQQANFFEESQGISQNDALAVAEQL